VGVTKTLPAVLVREGLAAGLAEIGENYVQEAEGKFAELGSLRAVRHLIGHLQRNKAGKAASLFDVVQSVDTVDLARALGRRAAEQGRSLEALLEVNISGEASKSGIRPEETLDLAAEIADIDGIKLKGLMGIGPLNGDPSAVRKDFQALRRLFEELPGDHRQVLSMGMTGDFEPAIAEGSTMVRIGTGIFGIRRSTYEQASER
jgi:pyridoxal phosphate enzyme (YggS family)